MAINYEELRRIELSEKKSAQLYKLPQDFYIDASNYLKQLQLSYDSLKQSIGDEGAARKLSMLGDQISNARESARSIYEMREKKMVTLAISASRGVALDLGALNPEERKVYDRILGVMREARDELLMCRRTASSAARTEQAQPLSAPPAQKTPDAVPHISMSAPAPFAAQDGPPERSEGSARSPPPAQPDGAKATIRAGAANGDYVTVRVMDEMPQFVGNDGRKYSLKKGDIASIHRANAAILERHGKVEAII